VQGTSCGPEQQREPANVRFESLILPQPALIALKFVRSIIVMFLVRRGPFYMPAALSLQLSTADNYSPAADLRVTNTQLNDAPMLV
jgi:hypothetical protein